MVDRKNWAVERGINGVGGGWREGDELGPVEDGSSRGALQSPENRVAAAARLKSTSSKLYRAYQSWSRLRPLADREEGDDAIGSWEVSTPLTGANWT